jgi:hypothetical protein
MRRTPAETGSAGGYANVSAAITQASMAHIWPAGKSSLAVAAGEIHSVLMKRLS